MRILVIDGHPDAGSYGEAVARAYVEGAESGRHDVRVFRLREMDFDDPPWRLQEAWRTRLDKVNDVSQTERVKWLEDVKRLGRHGR